MARRPRTYKGWTRTQGKEQADTARQQSKQIQTHTLPEPQGLPCPPRSSGLLSSQLGHCPASLQQAPPGTPPKSPQSDLVGSRFGSCSTVLCLPLTIPAPNHTNQGLTLRPYFGQHFVISTSFTPTMGVWAWKASDVTGRVIQAHFTDEETSSGIRCLASHWPSWGSSPSCLGS